jgi:hypothetical protein
MQRQSSSTTSGRRRRWYQFSLRTLIIVMMLISILLGTFAIRLERARRQTAAVATIRKHGGHVVYDYSFPDDNPRFSILQSRAKSGVPPWAIDALGVDFFHNVVGVTAWRNEEMSDEERQEVFQAIRTLQENELGWVFIRD